MVADYLLWVNRTTLSPTTAKLSNVTYLSVMESLSKACSWNLESLEHTKQRVAQKIYSLTYAKIVQLNNNQSFLPVIIGSSPRWQVCTSGGGFISCKRSSHTWRIICWWSRGVACGIITPPCTAYIPAIKENYDHFLFQRNDYTTINRAEHRLYGFEIHVSKITHF